MSTPFIDTDVIIRLLTTDDPKKAASAANLFQQVEAGALEVVAPDTVIADAVYVLTSRSLYNLPRAKVRELLVPLVRLPGFKLPNRKAILRALELFASTNLDFGDVLIVASMERSGSKKLYSYDTDFDKIAGVNRQEP